MKTILLTQDKVAQVDDEDYGPLIKYKWCAFKNGRRFNAVRSVARAGKKQTVYMHRQILKAKRNLEVDHRDGDVLNNQKSNLRLVTSAQNLQAFKRKRYGATSRFRGVSWDRRRRRWVAYIGTSFGHKNLGRFSSEKAAAQAYDSAAIKFFGEFACPNFPDEAR